MKSPTNFAYYLTQYLSKYLPGQVGASTNTIQSYRDTFSLLLQYLKTSQGIPPEKLTLEDFNKNRVGEFLAWLEEKRHCGIATRNQRLSAIQVFFRYLQIESPSHYSVSKLWRFCIHQAKVEQEGLHKPDPIGVFIGG